MQKTKTKLPYFYIILWKLLIQLNNLASKNILREHAIFLKEIEWQEVNVALQFSRSFFSGGLEA